MAAYYNEIDPFAAQWLRNLIAAGLIADGDVDERSIEDVLPSDLAGYTQCHFFAGIGGWAYALRLAGWPDDAHVWTGSCPCQPFSAAGKGAGFADERHLWPAWLHLIEQCRPAIVFGEQVASHDGLGWLDLVQADMEGAGYACGPVDFCAAGVGASHIRQRLWFVANANDARPQGWRREELRERSGQCVIGAGSASGGLANSDQQQWNGSRDAGAAGRAESGHGQIAGMCGDSGACPTNGAWRSADWLLCRDGKWRPVEPGTSPLAHGIPARVGRLRGYGNAIVPQVAVQIISAYMSTADAIRREGE